jgi:hypothetical protein
MIRGSFKLPFGGKWAGSDKTLRASNAILRHLALLPTRKSYVINTGDEVRGIMQERLYVDSPPLGSSKLSDWVRAYRREIGRRYTSELQRRFDRVSAYPSID